jgi:hypothetical protein
MASILREYGTPYFMKVDIEAWDRFAVRGLLETGARPQFVSVENGNGPLLPLLREAGYSGFKWIDQSRIQDLELPHPAREGADIDFHFCPGSSGPFGEETPGTWLTAEEVAARIDAYWQNPHRDANVDGWFDLHARL